MPAAASGEASVMFFSTCSRESWLGMRSRPCEPSASRSCASPVFSSSSSWSMSCSTPWSTPMSVALRAKKPSGSGSRSMRGTMVSQNNRSVVRCVSVRLMRSLSSEVASIGTLASCAHGRVSPRMTELDRTRITPAPSAEGAPKDGRPRGGSLLAQISNAMVRIHKEHWGKGPTKARTIYAEDIVLTRLEQIFTQAEATLIGVGREEEVRNMRLAFQRELEHEFVGAVERLTGRKVQAFISEVHAATNMGIELFVLEPIEPPADPSADEPRDPGPGGPEDGDPSS